jgi:hypothetical protein
MARRTHVRYRVTARRTVARDTLTILGGALLAVIAGNLAGFSGLVGDLASPTPEDTSTIIGGGSLPPRPTFPPVDTLGPIVNPTVGFEATPTPIPIITLGPTESPSPSTSVGPSTKPSVKPSAKPSPTAVPSPTPIQAVAAFSCTVNYLTLDCTDLSTNATGWDWDWGDGFHTLAGGPQSHTYLAAGSYTVNLTVTPIGPNFSATHTYVMTDPPPTP